MVDNEDVPLLLKRLCQSFVPSDLKNYITQSQRQKREEKFTNQFRLKALDCILFDYDEEYTQDNFEYLLQDARHKAVCGRYGMDESKKLHNALDHYLESGDEHFNKVLSFLLPLAESVQKQRPSVMGYGQLPQPQSLTLDLLHEREIFEQTPLLAPPDHQMYTYYPPSLFADSVMTVADSAFSELSSSCASSLFATSNYPICDPREYGQLPSTSDGSYFSKPEQSLRLTESQTNLYGALSNPYICEDLQSYLELPPIDLAPASFDYSKQSTSAYPSVTASELQIHSAQTSADSGHARTDSGLGGEILPVSDNFIEFKQPISWELKRKCGGFIGCDIQERPYLTEAGPTAFDLLYRLNLSCQLQIDYSRVSRPDVKMSQGEMVELESRRHLYNITMKHLMEDVSKLLLGVSSKCFHFDKDRDCYIIKPGLVVSGLSSQSLASVCQVLIDCGTYYYRLNKLVSQQVPGLTITAFLRSVSHYISTYTAATLEVSPRARSPLHMSRILNKQLQQIKFVASLCFCDGADMRQYPPDDLPDGVDLLSYIYKQAENFNCHHTYHLMLSLLYDTSQPYLRFLQDWVFTGRCSDPFEEFIIIVDPSMLEAKDRSYWTQGYLLDEQMKKQCLFIGELSDSIYLGGKSLSLLRKIVPDHDIFTDRTDPPTLDICLTEDQRLNMTYQSNMYIERVKAMIKHKLITRQQKLDEKAQKRVEAIQKAQALQAERLAEIYKKMSERKQREQDKKKKFYNDLRENLDQVTARKLREEKEEKKRDAELVESLAKREQLQSEADAKLEQQAKEELIEYYRLLSETAAARERKALWRIRRHQLSEAREQWLMDQENEIQQLLQQQEQIGKPENRAKWSTPDELTIKVQPDETDNVVDPLAAVHTDEVIATENPADSGDITAQSADASTPVVDITAQISDAMIEPEVTESKSDETQSETKADPAQPLITTADHVWNSTDKMPALTTSVSVEPQSSPRFSGPPRRATSILDSSFRPSSAMDSPMSLDETLAEVLSGGPISGLVSRRATRAVEGQHASRTTFDTDYLIRRTVRRKNPNDVHPQKPDRAGKRLAADHHKSKPSEIQPGTELTQKMIKHKGRFQTEMTASKQSDEPDGDILRLEKFKKINTKGHASHSSIQKIMYYGLATDDSVFEELDLPPIEAVKLDDITEDLTVYDDEHQIKYCKPPALIWTQDMTMRLDEGVSLYEHVSLPLLLQESVATALTLQISLSNQAVLNYFMYELEFDKHMEILHDYLLMAKGEFSLALTYPLFEKLHSHDAISTYYLSDTLGKALQQVPLKDNPFTDNIAISKTKIPRNIEAYSLNAFSWLSLTYKITWPMNILIPPDQLSKYERIFSFMVSLQHISYLLTDSWHSLKLSTQTHDIDSSRSQHFRQLHLIRHDMQHFVKVMHGYLALQVTQVSWHQFQTELKTQVKDLDGLYDSHNRFINRCLLRCFLSHKLQQIKQVVDGILKAILKFHALLRLGHWDQDEQGEFIHTEYDAIIKTYLPFKEFTQFLNKVLIKMTESDKNQHLKELQVMLNFNGYYQKSGNNTAFQ